MNIKACLVLALLTLLFLASVSSGKHSKKELRKKLKVVKQGMTRSDKSVLRKHRCKVEIPEEGDRNEQGFARWTQARLRCKNLAEPTYNIAICDPTCIDPVTGHEMAPQNYSNVPYDFGTKMVRRKSPGNATWVYLPVSCQCVETKKPKKKRNKSRRQKNGTAQIRS